MTRLGVVALAVALTALAVALVALVALLGMSSTTSPSAPRSDPETSGTASSSSSSSRPSDDRRSPQLDERVTQLPQPCIPTGTDCIDIEIELEAPPVQGGVDPWKP